MKKKQFNSGWEFTTIDTEQNAGFAREMTCWREVLLPHDWTTDFEFNRTNPSAHQGSYVQMGVGWYRKYFVLSEEDISKQNMILFDGVYHRSTVYLNGEVIGGREYGYSSFTCDLSPYAKVGLNSIVVKVDCSDEPSSRWFNGAGITRNVWLLQGGHQFIPYCGCHIKVEEIAKARCQVEISTTVINKESACKGNLFIDIINVDKIKIQSLNMRITIPEGESNHDISGFINHPNFWSCDKPYLYTCKVELVTEECDDRVEERFGVRTLEFIPHKGFYLNRVPTVFKGVCMHHDGGCVGAAVPKALWKKRILMLKEMGCNAIRTSHNPFNPEFYDLCDELGVMVVDEIFDGWDVPKVPNDYSNLWQSCYEKDLVDFIKRDRNHASVVLWSVGNEVLQMRPELTTHLMEIVRTLDETRKITAGINDISEASDKNRAVLDIAGYNDGGGACFLYEEDHEKRPEQLLFASEAPHSLHTRGFYRTQTWWRDKNQPRIEIPNLTTEEVFSDQSIFYNSSYDNAGVRTCVRDSWEFVEKYPYLCGEFRWTGFDYIGEALPEAWPARTNHYGVIDLANFKKDHYYLYQSMWSEEKMIHLLPHWTHPTIELGTEIPVWVYTNCESAELFLNGQSLGKKLNDEKHLQWLVPYTPGVLEAKGYENGEVVASKQHQTASSPAGLQFTAEILPDECERVVEQWTFEVTDEEGNFVPYSNNITGLHVSGCEIIGSDNGAVDDMTYWRSPIRRAFNGLGMYLIRHLADNATAEGVLGYILGESYFDEVTSVTLGVKNILANGESQSPCTIYYTLDGSTPDRRSTLYTHPFVIRETTCVKMVVYQGEEKIIAIQDLFTKGKPEPVIDRAHLNYTVLSDTPVGPFSEKLIGNWFSGGVLYRIQQDGKIFRVVGTQETHLGYWWYDFPTDFLETPNYAGTGEIWFASGEKCHIEFENQQAKVFVMDNESKAIAATYCTEDRLVFSRGEEGG